MITNVVIIVLVAILLPWFLFYEKGEIHKGMVPTKLILSLLFIAAVNVQPHPIPGYFRFLLTGLIFCAGGDLFLALPQKSMFMTGLVSFLIGHVFYIVAFFHAAQLNAWTWIGTVLAVIASGWVYVWLKPHLRKMNLPVIIYILVITAMVSGAFSILGDVRINLAGRILVFTGAFLFYISDIFVARHRFFKKEFLNRLIGLPLYFTGQFILAFSIGLLSYV
ncbi:MAG: lysoplasmalogenase [Deltaproteobacteria bacterium]|nr:lysoplasmalogenase [Deltaproteobacteria bacterium]